MANFINIGTEEIVDLYLGETSVNSIYLGDRLLYVSTIYNYEVDGENLIINSAPYETEAENLVIE